MQALIILNDRSKLQLKIITNNYYDSSEDRELEI